MDLIQLKGVTKRFGGNLVLDSVSLNVEEGEILGIVGMNGSGKTTLLKVMVGYYKPEKGSLFYKGIALSNVKKQVQREVGFAAQESSFYPELTVEENISYFGSLYGMNEKQLKEHIERVLVFLGLMSQKNQMAGKLSGGMQRRLEMACSLVHDPKILILDEPTEDLDPLLRREILTLIKQINKLGTTIIITSHLLGDVESLCDRIAVLHQGRILRIGRVEDFRAAYGWKEEIHLQTESGRYDSLIRDLRLKEFYVDGNKLVVYTNQADRLVQAIMMLLQNEQDKLVYLDVKRPSLQDVFEEITDKKWL